MNINARQIVVLCIIQVPVMPLKLLLFCSLMLFAGGLAPEVNGQPSPGNLPLVLHYAGKDTSFTLQDFKPQTHFSSEQNRRDYVSMLPAQLNLAGYLLASVDSTWMQADTLHALVYAGERFSMIQLSPSGINEKALQSTGWGRGVYRAKALDFGAVYQLQQRLLNYYENNGYPFAKVYLDSISIEGTHVSAVLKADPAHAYKIDSLRVIGKSRIRHSFLEQYLGIPKGSLYNRSKLKQVDKKISELGFVTATRPSSITMLGSGGILDLYLDNRKNSQVSVLLGLMPQSDGQEKLLLTGDVLLDLKNSFGRGENILFKWQQLQRSSPRLNLGFNLPFIFNSRYGVDFLFDLFKKDTSFLQVNGQLGLTYTTTANHTGKLLFQLHRTSLLEGGIDTQWVKQRRQLPDIMDVQAMNVGLEFDWSNTDYRLNPRKGWEAYIITTVGIKRTEKSNTILSLNDPDFNFAQLYDSIRARGYQWRLKLSGSKYFPVARQATVKTTLSSGLYFADNIFRNDLFQIGGFKLLRGFDEESIYTDRYAVGSAEFRYLMGLNAYLFMFADAGWIKNSVARVSNRFFSGGLGMVFETGFGLLNVSYALGKRSDVPFRLREGSRLHFGYTNYF